MKKIIEKDKLKGYQISENIMVHKHITDPLAWFVTIHPLRIYGQFLCDINCSEEEILNSVIKLIEKLEQSLKAISNEIHPLV